MSLIMLLVAAWAAGSWMVRPMRFSGAERVAIALLAGLCAVAIPVIAIGTVSLAAVQIVLAIAVIVYLVWRARRTAETTGTDLEPRPFGPRSMSRAESLCAAAAGVALGMGFVSAVAPTTSWDAASAHLALAQDYVREGRIHVFEGNSYSAYPHLLHSLYATAYWNGGERAVGLLNWTFALCAVLACYALGNRIGTRTSALLGAALFATTPIFFDQAGNCGIDLPFAALVLAAVTVLYAWHASPSAIAVALAGLLAGSSCGVRHTGFIVCALLAIGIVWTARTYRVQTVGIFVCAAALAAAPWMLRSTLTTGNPTYPVFASAFGDGGIADDQATPIGSHETVQSTNILAAPVFPMDVIVRPWRYDGWMKSAGPMVIVLGLPAIFAGGRKTIPLGLFAYFGAVPFYFFQRVGRYVFPLYGPLFAASGLVPSLAGKRGRLVWAVASGGIIAGLVLGAAMTHFKVPSAMGLKLRGAYLNERIDRYAAFEWLNANADPLEAVLTLDPRAFYIDQPTYANIYALSRIANASESEQTAWLNEHDIRYVLYPVAYVTESPVFAGHGLDTLAQKWLDGAAGFEVAATIQTPRRDGAGNEVTHILKRNPDR